MGDPATLPPHPADPSPVRWIFYPSGTTADPKGARLTAEHAYRRDAVVTVYVGSSEIQGNIIARRALSLPAGALG